MNPTIEIDGYPWFLRAGEPFGTYETVTAYLGRRSVASSVAFVAKHNIKKLKHGKQTIVSKPQIDAATGATSR